MPKRQKRIRAVDSVGNPFRGVYFYEKKHAGGKVTRTFYITYFKDGKVIEEKAGVASPGFRAADAAAMRARRVNGEENNKERRLRLAQEALAAQEAEKKKVAAWTMEKVFNAYMAAQGATLVGSRWVGGHKSAAQDCSRWKKQLAPLVGTKAPADIVKLDLDRLRKAIRDGGYSPSTLKNSLELLRRLLNWTRSRGLCPVSAVEVKIPKKLDVKKTEFLTPGQIQRLLRTLEEEPDPYLVGLVKMALLTGMRRGELFKLQWVDVDLVRGFVKIRDPKGGRDKEIPLSSGAVDVLKALPRRPDSPFVFPGRGGQQRQDSAKGLRRIRKNADLPTDFRMLHGLRHTFASSLASSGRVDLMTLQKLLTHESPQMTQRYAHLADRTVRQAAEVMSEKIMKGKSDDRTVNQQKGDGHGRKISRKSLRRKR